MGIGDWGLGIWAWGLEVWRRFEGVSSTLKKNFFLPASIFFFKFLNFLKFSDHMNYDPLSWVSYVPILLELKMQSPG